MPGRRNGGRGRRRANPGPAQPAVNAVNGRRRDNPLLQSPRKVQQIYKCIFNLVKNHRLAAAFKEPVNHVAYLSVIKNPMDFKTVSKRLRSGYYTSVCRFVFDMMTIFDNGGRLNGTGSQLCEWADELSAYFLELMMQVLDYVLTV